MEVFRQAVAEGGISAGLRMEVFRQAVADGSISAGGVVEQLDALER